MAEYVGIGVSPGRASGRVARMPEPVAEPPAETGSADGADSGALIVTACGRVRDQLLALAAKVSDEGKAILEAAALMAVDPVLVDGARRRVSASMSPARAVWEAAEDVAAALRALDGRVSERASDVTNVRDRIVAELSGVPPPALPDRPEPFILIARDLAPADVVLLDATACIAVVTADGGPTSHTAILLRSLRLPAIVAARGVLELAEDTVVLLDGSAGTVYTNPRAADVARTRAPVRVRTFDGRGKTADGHHVPLMANVGGPSGVAAAVAASAEGVGLFRTEFCFLDRPDAPSIDDQVSAYRQVLAAFPGQQVVVRTLDAGADKPLPFLDQPAEPNPALGIRGLRISAHSEQLLNGQLAAISCAAQQERADVWVMAPMVSTAGEAAAFVAQCDAAGLGTAGVMVEVPAAALSAGRILQSARFASIGTNDLAQYTMAADRNTGALADLTDPWQPAVLQLVQLTCQAGQHLNRPVGVCGEAAADPALACVLVGLGASSLSMTPQAIPDIAEALRTVSYDDCIRLAELAVTAAGAREARQSVRAQLPGLAELGL